MSRARKIRNRERFEECQNIGISRGGNRTTATSECISKEIDRKKLKGMTLKPRRKRGSPKS